uniref:Uncharacterized protein n=1 Tax=Romanomermis culicivorax TaxID=13658 RepID=A0A915JHL7_ROMCU
MVTVFGGIFDDPVDVTPILSATVGENPDENCVPVKPKFRHERHHPSTTYAVWQTSSSPVLDVGQDIPPLP